MRIGIVPLLEIRLGGLAVWILRDLVRLFPRFFRLRIRFPIRASAWIVCRVFFAHTK